MNATTINAGNIADAMLKQAAANLQQLRGLRPFDLDEAKAGAPLQTRNGRTARFIGHIPEADPDYRVVVFIDGDSGVSSYADDGAVCFHRVSEVDLFMAPQNADAIATAEPVEIEA